MTETRTIRRRVTRIIFINRLQHMDNDTRQTPNAINRDAVLLYILSLIMRVIGAHIHVRMQVSTESKARLATDDEINEARWSRLRKLGKKARRDANQRSLSRCCLPAAAKWPLHACVVYRSSRATYCRLQAPKHTANQRGEPLSTLHRTICSVFFCKLSFDVGHSRPLPLYSREQSYPIVKERGNASRTSDDKVGGGSSPPRILGASHKQAKPDEMISIYEPCGTTNHPTGVLPAADDEGQHKRGDPLRHRAAHGGELPGALRQGILRRH